MIRNHMEKSSTLNLRVNPVVKARAESVLSQLGIPMSTAIDMYLNQISPCRWHSVFRNIAKGTGERQCRSHVTRRTSQKSPKGS